MIDSVILGATTNWRSSRWRPICSLRSLVTSVAGVPPIIVPSTCSKWMGLARGFLHMPSCSTMERLIRHRVQPVSMMAPTSPWTPISGTVSLVLMVKGRMAALTIRLSLLLLSAAGPRGVSPALFRGSGTSTVCPAVVLCRVASAGSSPRQWLEVELGEPGQGPSILLPSGRVGRTCGP